MTLLFFMELAKTHTNLHVINFLALAYKLQLFTQNFDLLVSKGIIK